MAIRGAAKIRSAAKVHERGSMGCHSVRYRYSGPTLFVDAHISMDGNLPLIQAHELADQVEQTVRSEFPGADVTVHTEPPGALDR